MGYSEDYQRPLPHEVPGFAEAGADGLLPVVPPQPPLPRRPLPRSFLWQALALFLGGILVVLSLPDGFVSWTLGPYLVGGLGVAVLAGTGLLLGRCLQQAARESVHGYTTLAVQSGTPDWASLKRFTRAEGPAWDWSGAWHLSPTGRVLREPDRRVLPPGWYPSPGRPGRFELWTGDAWACLFRTPEQVRALRDGG